MPRTTAKVARQRERQILHLMSKGYTHKQIARQVGVTPGAVSETLGRMRERYGVETTFQLAYRLGMAARCQNRQYARTDDIGEH